MTYPSSAVGRWLSGCLPPHHAGEPSGIYGEFRRRGAGLVLLSLSLALANPFQVSSYCYILPLLVFTGITRSAAVWSSVIIWMYIFTPSFAGKGFAFLGALIPVLAGSGSGRLLRKSPKHFLLILLAITPVILLALVQWSRAVPSPAGWFSENERLLLSTRVTGIYGNPNLFAGVLIFLIPFGTTFGITTKCPGFRWVAVGWITVAVLVLILTFSHGAWIAVLFELLILLRLVKENQSRQYIRIGFMIIIVLCGLVTLVHLGDTALYRLGIWQGVGRLVTRNPWGYGPGGFSRYYPSRLGVFPADHAHNLLLQVLIEEGIPGTVILMTIGCWTVWRMKRNPGGIWRWAAMAALAGQAIFGLVDYVWATPLLMGLFWMGEALTLPEVPKDRI